MKLNLQWLYYGGSGIADRDTNIDLYYERSDAMLIQYMNEVGSYRSWLAGINKFLSMCVKTSISYVS